MARFIKKKFQGYAVAFLSEEMVISPLLLPIPLILYLILYEKSQRKAVDVQQTDPIRICAKATVQCKIRTRQLLYSLIH